ncbi:formylglycine-generating enzyme family protein [Nocardia takedensis]
MVRLGMHRNELLWLEKRYRNLDQRLFDSEPSERTALLTDYEIGRFPVTNAEYLRFVDDSGYRRTELWSLDGREWLRTSRRDRPKFWQAERWIEWCAPEKPVVGITWYEAEAYARWMHRRLPSGNEWEYAARGPDALRFPWGEEFCCDYANVVDYWLKRPILDVNEWRSDFADKRPWRENSLTTPVDMFPEGISPFGVFDMSGNVWEWCSGGSRRVKTLRGGSFGYMSWSARTTEVARHPPWWSSLGIGFRIGPPIGISVDAPTARIDDLIGGRPQKFM